MSFRKRNVGLSSGSPRNADTPSKPGVAALPGIRPSPLDGRPTTSTGTATLDGLLAGHAGIALGTSLLVEESGTTDYAGVLLRFYAAEGLVQGHHVHVVGLPEQWGRNLPGLAETMEGGLSSATQDKMKIAWRYENLGQFGGGQASRDRAKALQASDAVSQPSTFCHTFDLAKKLAHPADSVINFLRMGTNTEPPFAPILEALSKALSSNPDLVHRVVLPSLLSPALYPSHASLPEHVLCFMHELRALLAVHQGRVTVMASLPLSLYPRSSGLVRWMELLSDGVLELSPFPHSSGVETQSKSGSGSSEEPLQGLLRIHRLPVLHDRGSGTVAAGTDWAFNMSRRKFSIVPFSLPPIEGDAEAQQRVDAQQRGKKADLEF